LYLPSPIRVYRQHHTSWPPRRRLRGAEGNLTGAYMRALLAISLLPLTGTTPYQLARHQPQDRLRRAKQTSGAPRLVGAPLVYLLGAA
jgi:hypothetical protein